VLLGVLGIAWLVVTALLARSQLNSVKSELPRLQSALSSGDFDQARAISQDLATHARRAHELTTGPAWWVSANIPVVGAPLDTARTIAAQGDVVGQRVLPGVLKLADELNGESLRNGNSINLAPLVSARPVLASSASAASAAAHTVDQTPKSTWLPFVDRARDTVTTQLNSISDELTGASRTVRTLLPMLGQSGLQRYFIGFENEAESRGLGGLPGSFAIVTADHGTIRFTHFEDDSTLDDVHVKLDLGADFAARYGVDDPTGLYINSDISPNFPYAAKIWAAMWQKKSGERIDGAIAIDPTALGYLLAVTGPAQLPDGSSVGADNIVSLTQQQQYSMFPDKLERKAYLLQVSKAISDKLISGSGSNIDLIRAAAKAAGERRLVVWSRLPSVQANIAASGYGGIVEGGHGPVSGFTVVNGAGTKLDFYLGRSMSYQRTGCSAGSTAVATLKLTNGAPRSGLPSYVTTWATTPPKGIKPGDNLLLVTYYASTGATIRSVTVDGKPITLASATENGLVTVSLALLLPVGSTHTIAVTTSEPAADSPVQILRQPLALPLQVSVSGDRCG
jgi:hypothetical protein